MEGNEHKNEIQFGCDERILLAYVWGKSPTVVGQMYARKIFTELMVVLALLKANFSVPVRPQSSFLFPAVFLSHLHLSLQGELDVLLFSHFILLCS
jgi:hypothetical protein